ncbi:MAG: hypothetical protein ACR2FY_20395 [Pirellulaceae bacterium]
MSPRNSPPLEAVLLPDARPRKSWVPFIMGTILVGSCLLAVMIGIWGLVKLAQTLDRQGTFAGGRGSDHGQSTGDKQAEYRAVFKVPVVAPQSADVPQVEKLLARYVTAAKDGDEGGLARLVDVDAFLQRMQDHPDMPRLDGAGRKALLELLNKSLQMPENVTAFRLLGLQRQGKEGAAMADVIFKNSDGHSEPCRIWLQQKERVWSVVDWEVIQQGKSAAGQWAGSQRTGQDYYATMYDEFVGDLEKADDCYNRGDIRGALQVLQASEQQSIPEYVRRENQWGVAYRYYQYRQYQIAIDSLRTVSTPDEVPGVYVLRALCYQALGDGEKALAAAADYERVCGFAPDVARAKALALAQLERKAEAITELKRLLEFDPSDMVALQNLVRLLPVGQKGQIASLIAGSKDPPETALAIATSFLILEDEETTQAIKSLLEKKYSGSPATHAFVARMHQHNEDFDLAAAAFRRAHAAEADADKKKQHWQEYVSAMHSAGKLVQAYEESPDSVEIFAYLTGGVGEEESVVGTKDLPPLLEAHRRRAPRDPQLYYCTGHLARQQGDLAAAEQAFAAGESQAKDETQKEQLQSARLEVLADQGRILDAYRDYESLDGTFQTLAAASIQQKKPSVLEELLRIHRKSNPQDPELTYYTIALDIERGNYPQALQAMPRVRGGDELEETMQSILRERALNNLDDPMVRRLMELQVDAYFRYDRWEQAILQNPPYADVLSRLASRFAETGAWDKLRKLLAMPYFRETASGQVLLHEMKLAWHFRDYGQIEFLVPRWDAALWADVPPHEQKSAQVMLVRSLLRQGKTTAAYGFAEQFQRESQEEFPLLLVRLAQGDTKDVKEMLKRERYRIHAIELDPEMLPLLTDPRFAPLRRESPLELPSGSPRTSLVLFLRSDVPLDEEKLRKLLPSEGDFQVKLLPDSPRPGQTLAVTHAGGTLYLTSSAAPYQLPSEDWSRYGASRYLSGASSQPIASNLKMHTAWLAMELWDSPAALTGPREDRLAKSLVQKLCGENLLALALDDPYTSTTLTPGSLLRADSLTPERSWKEWLAGGTQVWLMLGNEMESVDNPLVGRKAQREFAAAVSKLPAGQFAQVRVDLALGHVAEEVWLKLVRIERLDYGGHHLICELAADSQLYPQWKAGELCNVSFWRVRETKLPEAK